MNDYYLFPKAFLWGVVNYRMLQRTPKLSGKFYREVIARNAVV